ncbi:MAG: hypothetical protein Q9208_004195 [Pyrenodesmia sp. 3 TL-2023]
MTLGLETIQWTWARIGKILEGWADEQEAWRDEMGDIIAQINRSLSGGSLVLSALEQDLKPYDNASEYVKFGLRTRTRILWNEQTLKDHQERIRDQVNSMLMNSRPEATARKSLLAEGQRVFRKSDDSAYSIVPSRAPDSIRDRFSRLSSTRSEKSLAYHELSIDDDLFTARVYKRNYQNPTIIRRMIPSPVQSSTSPEGALSVGNANSSEIPDLHPERKKSSPFAISSGSAADPSAEISKPQMSNLNALKKSSQLPTSTDNPFPFWKPTKWTVGIQKHRTIEGPPLSLAVSRADPTKQTKSKDNCILDLTSVVDNGDLALFEDLLARWTCIPSLWLHHCLMTACARGRAHLAKLLLKRRASIPTIDGLEKLYGASSPVKLALRRRDLKIVRLLLQDLRTRNSCRRMDFLFIWAAIELGDATFLQYTIDFDANIDQEISSGKKAVHLACQHRSFSCLGVLIKAGASLAAPDRNGISAIGYLLWKNPSKEISCKDIPFLPAERRQAVEAVLGPEAMGTDTSRGPEYSWAYREAMRTIARTILSKPRFFAEFVYCNYDLIGSKMPLTVGRPEVVVAMETLADVSRYSYPMPGPEPKPILITRPSG